MFEFPNRALIPALAAGFALFLTACPGDAPPPDDPDAVAAPVLDVPDAATIQGHAMFQGTPPELSPIDMRDEPACADRHPERPVQQEVAVAGDGSLGNVFVYVREGLAIDRFPTPQEGVELDQQGCIYRPRVIGVQTGQTLVVRNSDGLLHNVNASPRTNRPFNFSQPVNMTTNRTFTAQEVMIPVRCDVHGWMRAYIGVVDHPYFAVSQRDGTFTIDNLPPGDYVLEAWHERYGTQTLEVSVGPNETAEIHVMYRADMAGNPVPLGEPIDLHDHAGGHGHTAGAGSAGR
jgi:plastocyanin